MLAPIWCGIIKESSRAWGQCPLRLVPFIATACVSWFELAWCLRYHWHQQGMRCKSVHNLLGDMYIYEAIFLEGYRIYVGEALTRVLRLEV